jgi:hypothetical protein
VGCLLIKLGHIIPILDILKSSPEIWFETEHFENLGFSGPGLRVPLVTSLEINGSREKLSWILEIWKV